MSAERLREAAKVLRERAESATGGPWVQVISKQFGPQSAISTGVSNLQFSEYANEGEYRGGQNALYIATMHPGVGLALVESLDQHAEDHSSYDCRFEPCAMVAVADAILGGA